MRRIPVQLFLAALTAALVMGTPQESKAFCCLFDGWGAYRPTYSAYYAPAYSTYYAPSYYSASYWPTTSYYVGSGYGGYGSCCSTGCCGQQATYSAPSCCSPCNSCAPCGSGCSSCSGGDCGLASSTYPDSATSRSGSSGQPTFIDEEDRSKGSQYDANPMNPPKNGTNDGFTPRKSDETTDPLDQQGFGDSSADVSDSLKFNVPEMVTPRRKPAPTQNPDSQPVQRVKDTDAPSFPAENFDAKITSRSVAHRTRLVERRSWEQPVIANNVTREVPEANLGWVPVPAPTQVVQK